MNYIGNPEKNFHSVKSYWESRYASGGTSGAGSYGNLATYKASYLNDFVKKNNISKVIEFGCGDGNQLSFSNYPLYIGLDISKNAIDMCRLKYNHDLSKQFFIYETSILNSSNDLLKGDLTISLDVIFHLVDDIEYDLYMKNLFKFSTNFVIIYSSNNDDKQEVAHMKHRKFTRWVTKNEKNFVIEKFDKNIYPYDGKNPDSTSVSDFYIYKKVLKT